MVERLAAQRARHASALGRTALGLAGCLVLFGLALPALPAAAPASTLASGFKFSPAATTAVELAAQYPAKQRRIVIPPKKKNPPKRYPRYVPPKGPKVVVPPRSPPYSGPRRPPPVLVFPKAPAEVASYVEALPRHVQRPPQGRALPQRVERQILVLVDQGQPQSLGAQLERTYGLQLLSSRLIVSLAARVELFRVRAGRSETAALAALQRDTRIRSAQFNLLYFHTSDKRREAVVIPQYGPRNVRLPDAHKLALGRNVAIAVIDSAVDREHPDLKGAVVRWFDAVGDRDLAPDYHGTAVAGIIRSRGVVEGVAPQSQILAIRAMRAKAGSVPEANSADLLVGIDWAIVNGANVLNMSFANDRRDPALQELLQKAQQKRIVLVAAAGNKGPNAKPAFPAAYPGVIAVTAVDEADRRYQHANRGPHIAVAAPGVEILAPVQRGGYAFLSGTSFATAYVSGIAALLLERDPTMDPAAIARLIAAGADDIGPVGRDDDFGAGRVNALVSLLSMRDGLAVRQ